jgi:hypothetical protein
MIILSFPPVHLWQKCFRWESRTAENLDMYPRLQYAGMTDILEEIVKKEDVNSNFSLLLGLNNTDTTSILKTVYYIGLLFL